MPFDVESFLAVFAAYNEAIWPLRIGAYLACAGVVGAALCCGRGLVVVSHPAAAGRDVGNQRYRVPLDVFRADQPGGASFRRGLRAAGRAPCHRGGADRPRPAPGREPEPATRDGLALIVFSGLVYPLWGAWVGHSYPATPMFGGRPARPRSSRWGCFSRGTVARCAGCSSSRRSTLVGGVGGDPAGRAARHGVAGEPGDRRRLLAHGVAQDRRRSGPAGALSFAPPRIGRQVGKKSGRPEAPQSGLSGSIVYTARFSACGLIRRRSERTRPGNRATPKGKWVARTSQLHPLVPPQVLQFPLTFILQHDFFHFRPRPIKFSLKHATLDPLCLLDVVNVGKRAACQLNWVPPSVQRRNTTL